MKLRAALAGPTLAATQTVGIAVVAGGSFTTPAGTTQYTAPSGVTNGDLIANSAVAGSVVPIPVPLARTSNNTFILRRIRVKTADTGFAGATVRVHVYRDSPTVTNGDNGAYLTNDSNEACEVDVPLSRHFTDYEKGIGTPNEGAECTMDAAANSQNAYVLVEARTAATPVGAKTWTVVIEAWQN
jgi:hypothetical protein